MSFADIQSRADAGDVQAMFQVGEAYDNGTEGCKKDVAEAYKWYSKAASTGAGHPVATRFAAWALCTGTGVAADIDASIKLYKKAATEHKDIKSMSCLGFFYEKGQGVTADPKQAFTWYEMAANGGDSVAQVNLALCYEKGNGVEKDGAKAFYWFNKASEGGNVNAYINVGVYYEKGEGGVTKDMKTALSWYLKAAELGDATAMTIVACCYENGEGTAVDNEKAAHYYTEGAMKGNSHAKEGLRRMMKANKV